MDVLMISLVCSSKDRLIKTWLMYNFPLSSHSYKLARSTLSSNVGHPSGHIKKQRLLLSHQVFQFDNKSRVGKRFLLGFL